MVEEPGRRRLWLAAVRLCTHRPGTRLLVAARHAADRYRQFRAPGQPWLTGEYTVLRVGCKALQQAGEGGGQAGCKHRPDGGPGEHRPGIRDIDQPGQQGSKYRNQQSAQEVTRIEPEKF